MTRTWLLHNSTFIIDGWGKMIHVDAGTEFNVLGFFKDKETGKKVAVAADFGEWICRVSMDNIEWEIEDEEKN